MKLIAHRGMMDKENTLVAFKNAIESEKTVGFECDIRLSKDNQIVVIHDSFLDRVFDDTGLVKDKTAEELKKIGVPTLLDVLKLDTDKIIMIEVKDENINPEKLVDLLNNYSNKNIYLMSFNTEFIHKVLKHNRRFKVGMLHNVFNKEKSYNEYDFIAFYAEFVTDNIINYFKERNIEIFLFGINEKNKRFKEHYSKLNYVYLIVDL